MGNELTTTEAPPRAGKDRTIKGMLLGESFKDAVQQTLPRHLTADRFLRIAVSALTRTPKLEQCEPASFFGSLMTLSQLGLEPDGRRAHLIPFSNTRRNVVECQLIVDYKGLVELVMRTGNVSYIHADVVCEADVFEFDRGEVKTHKIDFRRPRGSMYAAYALCRFKDQTEKADCMTKDEIDAIRARSRARDNGPWVTDYNEMAKKTVFKRLSKWIPWSPELADALEQDADALEERRLDGAKAVFSLPEPDNFVAPKFGPLPQNELAAPSPTPPPGAPEQTRRGPGRPRKEPPMPSSTASPTTAPAETTDTAPGDQPTPPAPETPRTATEELAAALSAVPFKDFHQWLITVGFVRSADEIAMVMDYSQVPLELASKVLADQSRLQRCIKLYAVKDQQPAQ